MKQANGREIGRSVGFKLGFFGANCSSGRYVTRVPERWSGNWEDNVRLAKLLDEAGIDFLLPIGRWKGYGGETDYQGTTYETITWATGLLAVTKHITIFGTVHAPLFHPLIAAKQMVTADHVGQGRFGLNLVCGWNEDEFEMFGVRPGDHEARYRQGQEWLDVVKMAWERDDFDFHGEFFRLHGVREKPKPFGRTRPLVMNAGSSKEGRAFALRNCDAWFTSVRLPSYQLADIERAKAVIEDAKAEGLRNGHAIGAYTVGVVVCRPTRKEALDYHRYVTEENVDWGAVDKMLEGKGLLSRPPDEVARFRKDYANGKSGLPFFGTPDDVAEGIAGVGAAGFDGIALSLVNYADEFPYFRDEVLPRLERLGVRKPVRQRPGV